MPIAPELLKELTERRAIVHAAGGAEKLADRNKKGLLSARERLEALFTPGTFMEFGTHAQHACHDFGMADKSMPGDGVVTGVGYVDGRPMAAFSQDFTVGGGALGRIHSKKICDLMD
jgi:propionyl-CoA carboxylase beta chain